MDLLYDFNIRLGVFPLVSPVATGPEVPTELFFPVSERARLDSEPIESGPSSGPDEEH